MKENKKLVTDQELKDAFTFLEKLEKEQMDELNESDLDVEGEGE